MATTVSVPEKTLEHWCSQYLTYRYRSHVALWWPARGVDIDVRGLPRSPGKMLSLELKTTSIRKSDRHEVLVDLGQLWDYTRKRPGRQPFYVFPWPDWTGELEACAVRSGVPVTEIGFSRSGPAWWFVNWMIVLSTQQVADVLAVELAAHGRSDRGTKRALVTFDFRGSPRRPMVEWGAHPGAPRPRHMHRLRDFWDEVDRCGRPDWPQRALVPKESMPGRSVPHAQLLALLQVAAERQGRQPFGVEELAVVASDGEGSFVVEEDPSQPDVDQLDGVDDGGEDHRIEVFLRSRSA